MKDKCIEQDEGGMFSNTELYKGFRNEMQTAGYV